MATTPPVVQEQTPAPAKAPMVPLMTAVVLGVIVSVAAVGGAGYFLIHSGKLRLQTMPEPKKPEAPKKTRAMLLEPLVVNLADSSGTAFLRVSIVLTLPEPEKGGKEGEGVEKGADAAFRDTAIDVLSRETAESLLATDGKERAKKALKDAMAERLPESKVVDLYFTDFLVQR